MEFQKWNKRIMDILQKKKICKCMLNHFRDLRVASPYFNCVFFVNFFTMTINGLGDHQPPLVTAYNDTYLDGTPLP